VPRLLHSLLERARRARDASTVGCVAAAEQDDSGKADA